MSIQLYFILDLHIMKIEISELSYISCYSRNLPDAAEPDIISTIKKTFNFGQSEAVHLFQTLMECMKRKELVSRF